MNLNNKIYNKDFVTEVTKIPNDTFDIIIIDPPYNIGKDFGNDSDKKTLSEYISWVKTWIYECQRVLKPTGTMFVYGFDEILAHISVLLPTDKQRWLTWYYTNKNVASLNFWQRSHESIICSWKSTPIFNRDNVREPYTKNFLKGSAGKKRPASLTGRGGHNESVYNANPKGALPRDVFSISTLAGGASLKERIIYCNTCNKLINPKERKNHIKHDLIIHPTQKPMSLTKKLILSAKPNSNFNVLVPFCGSGSECLCTLINGGTYVSFELNKQYIKLANANINRYKENYLF